MLLQKILDNVHTVPTKYFTSKINKHVAYSYYSHTFNFTAKNASMISTEVKTLKFAYLKEHATEIINCEKGHVVVDRERGKIVEETKILSHMERRIRRRI